MKRFSLLLTLLFGCSVFFSQSNSNPFHDTQGNIEVNGSGQLQFSLPIALPPGIKSVAPQINLMYTSGSNNGIAGYGWNLSGITSISRAGKNLDKDGKAEGIQLNYEDIYRFNGQRLILKSGEYGKDGSEYVTEKYSNVKIKSIGALSGKNWLGPEFWEVTFEDGSQAWYGVGASAKTPVEYNITKWKDAQGNYISYEYVQKNHVAMIQRILWGGNEVLNKPHFNEMVFTYGERDLNESSYVMGERLIQDKILMSIQVNSNGKQFKKYVINYDNGSNGTKYQFVKNITEYNSKNEPANPVTFEYEKSVSSEWKHSEFSDKDNKKLVGDFDGDGRLDFLKYIDAYEECVKKERRTEQGSYDAFTGTYTSSVRTVCVKKVQHPAGLYLFRGAFDDAKEERIYISVSDFSKGDFQQNSKAITFKDKNGIVKSHQGFVMYKSVPSSYFTSNDREDNIKRSDIELSVYSIEKNKLVKHYTKVIENKFFDRSSGSKSPYINNVHSVSGRLTNMIYNGGYERSYIGDFTEMDFDGDGISELVFKMEDMQCIFTPQEENTNPMFESPKMYVEDFIGERIVHFETHCSKTPRYVAIDLEAGLSPEKSIIPFYVSSNQSLDSYKRGDFNGDGVVDFLHFQGDEAYISNFKKDPQTQSYQLIQQKYGAKGDRLEGLLSDAFVGDFNGDGKMDLLVPKAKKSDQWKLYVSTGKGFVGKDWNNFSYYHPDYKLHEHKGRGYYFGRHYFVQDLNGDGKADFIEIGTFSKYLRDKDNNDANFIVRYFENKGIDSHGNIALLERNIDGHTKRYRNNDYEEYPFNIAEGAHGIATPHKFGALSPLVGNYTINQMNHHILLMHQEGGVMVKYSSYELGKASRINSITQGGLKTLVEYKELDPRMNPHFYEGIKSEKYPYVELDKVSQSYAVAQLRQEISSGKFRKQDFRYRGLVSHLKGKGMIGFRKTARSSWYADGFENTKVWSGVEIDPMNEGLPIKEWSIKTDNESEIFPTDLSFNNQRLLSLKTTNYKIDELLDGTKVTASNLSDKSRIVMAIVPTEVQSKDFLKEVTTIDQIEYDEYYLPRKTISSTNGGFAEKITTLSYYPPNLTGEGKDYHIGRPRSKEELVRAYGDSKGAKEEYEYENHLLKKLKTYNRDNTGYLEENYEYDGFGNILSKIISNSLDSHTQTTSSRYDDKGRFVVEKTDALGLITRITYNDWGQVLTQTDPLGVTLTNTYDAWGKLLRSKTNLSGITSYTYEKLSNGDAKVTEYTPDGGESITYINKIGQKYKSTTKVFDLEPKASAVVTPPVSGTNPVVSPPSSPVVVSPPSVPAPSPTPPSIPLPPSKPTVPSKPKPKDDFDISDLINCPPPKPGMAVDIMCLSYENDYIDKFRSARASSVNLSAIGQKNKYVSKSTEYDALERKVRESEPYFEGQGASQWNTIEYDEYSRPVKAIAFTGKIVETAYTKNTVTTTETNANGRFKKQTFDAIGNVISTEDKGGTIFFKYNAAGEQIEAKYGTNIVTMSYDAWGRKIEFFDPSNGRYRYEYNHGLGLLTKTISPKGEKSYTYNDKAQLISQKEASTDGSDATDKDIQFTYNDKGQILSKQGTSKGKSFLSDIRYDDYGRVLSVVENSYGKTYEKKNIVYDAMSRVVSYEKSLSSEGKTTSVTIEQVYDSRTGELYQLKDKKSGKVLWELKEQNAKGQLTKALLGGTKISNTYDSNGFLSFVRHEVENKPDLLSLSYSFNAIKNELNGRSRGGTMNILEVFEYDENNRLVKWTNPVTTENHYNLYDKEGRIIENDELGRIKFENSGKVYQPTGVILNSKGEELLKNNLIQTIRYNENNDPIFIEGVRGDVSFEYGLTSMRQKVSFGGKIEEQNSEGRYTRYYSEDGSFEVTRDNQTGQEKHILYIGGNPYESEIIFMKDYAESEGKYLFLHKDYLGSILAISDEEGSSVEQRHYDAWGNMTHLQIGNGAVLTGEELERAKAQMFLDRGYTSHEHFWEVGIIHMNGRLYDPLLRRFLNADENIQDPHNTQNYNKYTYVLNNPLMFNDPSGESIVGVIFAAIKIISTVISVVNTVKTVVGLINGDISFSKFAKSIVFNIVSSAVSYGVGEIFKAGGFMARTLGDFTFLAKAGVHGITQGILSSVQGNKFGEGASAGFLSSLAATGVGKIARKSQYKDILQVFSGSIAGGVGAVLAKGNFWRGVQIGSIVSTYNHTMHDEPPRSFDGDVWEDEDGTFTRRRDIRNGDKKVYSVNNSPDGIDILVQNKPTTLDKIDASISTVGIVSDLNEGLIGNRTKGVIGKYGKVLGKIGQVTGVMGAGIALYDVYNKPTLGNVLKAGISVGTLMIKTNPMIGLVLGISDITGFSDHVFRGVDNMIYTK